GLEERQAALDHLGGDALLALVALPDALAPAVQVLAELPLADDLGDVPQAELEAEPPGRGGDAEHHQDGDRQGRAGADDDRHERALRRREPVWESGRSARRRSGGTRQAGNSVSAVRRTYHQTP